MCTLLIRSGWKVEYVAISDSMTNAPVDLKEFFNQRRRWVPSTMYNTFDVLADWKNLTKNNPAINIPYVIYQMILNVAGLIAPMTMILLTQGSIALLFDIFGGGNVNAVWSLLLALLPPVIFVIICGGKNEELMHKFVEIATYIYCGIMLAVFIVLLANFFPDENENGYCGLCDLTNVFFLGLVSLYVVAAVLHPREFWCLSSGMIYYRVFRKG